MTDANVSVTMYRAPVQWLDPVQWSAGVLLRLGSQPATHRSVLETLRRLSPDDYLEFLIPYMEAGLERFGAHWGFVDLLTVLHAAAVALRPERYLEIGIRRGRSLAVVAAAHPNVSIYGFDIWVADYAGMTNPGPEFVEEEMRRLGYAGQLHLVSGDSAVTVPRFLDSHPDLNFDLVTVDGDHAPEGAAADLRHVLPRVKIGGALVFDDIAHPQHRALAAVWQQEVGTNTAFDTRVYDELGYGVAVAIRRGPDAA
jgi:predicted O-methyltransferase YrrM